MKFRMFFFLACLMLMMSCERVVQPDHNDVSGNSASAMYQDTLRNVYGDGGVSDTYSFIAVVELGYWVSEVNGQMVDHGLSRLYRVYAEPHPVSNEFTALCCILHHWQDQGSAEIIAEGEFDYSFVQNGHFNTFDFWSTDCVPISK